MKAEFRGHCDLCDDAIRPGDDIRRAAGGDEEDAWCHVDCLSRLEADVDKVLGGMGFAARPRCTYCGDLLAAGRCVNCGG